MPTSRRRHASTTRAQALARRANVKRRVPKVCSAEGSAARKIEDALLEMYRLAVEAEDRAPRRATGSLYYELVSARVIEDALGKRTKQQGDRGQHPAARTGLDPVDSSSTRPAS